MAICGAMTQNGSSTILTAKRGTAAEWAAANPTLQDGEYVMESDTRRMKMGDGTTAYTALKYLIEQQPTGGAAATRGVSAAMVAGVTTISTTAVTANSIILLTTQTIGTVALPKGVGVTSRVAGTSFTVKSGDATDTSTVGWMIVEP